MATDTASLPVNGTFVPHQGQIHGANEQTLTSHSASSTSSANIASDPAQEISKEEVGWYFVERYYTALSKTPERLFLFYNKRSQSVFGVEDEKAPVCVGQKAINDRMKELQFQDCKIRVTNVDSQESGSDIVIQVIGEISNKSAPHRKFVQTFVLARQTNGYFVLNDIFRYIAEEEEELVDQEESSARNTGPSGYQEPIPTAEQAEPKGLTSSNNVAEQEYDAQLVDEELEKVAEQDNKQPQAAPPAQVNGTPVPEGTDVAHADDAPAAAVGGPAADSAAPVAQEEKPQDPEPSPVQPPTAPAAATTAAKAPAAPPKPAAPKTWASLAASANRNAPPAATPAVATPTPQSQKPAPQAPSTSSNAAPAPAAPSQPQARESPDSDAQQGDGWQAVGSGHDRKQSRAQGQVSGEAPRFRAYIKNVSPNVDADALKSQLTKYGELAYFDVSRQKNCAFVDFATQAGFQAAVAANPHKLGNEEVFVEERRERPFQFQARGGMRGGRGGPDNRTGQGRGGFGKENARGGFQPRGRGGNVTPRGRSNGQTA